MYNYYEAIKEDIIEYIMDSDVRLEEHDLNELYDRFYDEMWTADSVTGNGSGSYTFNSHEAMENLYGNTDLIRDAVSDFGIDADTVADHVMDWEYWDVTIRCHLYSEILWETLKEWKEEEE